MPENAVVTKLVTEAMNAQEPARRTAAALLLSTVRREHPFGGPRAVIKLTNPGLSPDVLAEVDTIAHTLGLDPQPEARPRLRLAS
jgi:hypothetical protein